MLFHPKRSIRIRQTEQRVGRGGLESVFLEWLTFRSAPVNPAVILPRSDMTKRLRCKTFWCRKVILEETYKDNRGLCARCYKKAYPNKSSTECKPSLYEIEIKLPVEDLTDRQKRRHLVSAIRDANIDRINEIFVSGNDVIAHPPDSLSTWFGEAIRAGGNNVILNKLLTEGCDPNSRTKSPDRTTPLEVAIGKQQISSVEWLLENGADPNIGRPIVRAIHYEIPPSKQISILTLLLDSGAQLNMTFALYGDENDRFTVLDWALLYDSPNDVTNFLKSRGAQTKFGEGRISNLKRELKSRKIV